MKYLLFSWPPHHTSELSMSSSKFQMNYQMMKRWVRLRSWWGKVIALTAEVDSPCITCSLASGGNLSFIPLLQSNLSCLLSIGHSASKLGLQIWCSVRVVFLMKVWCVSICLVAKHLMISITSDFGLLWRDLYNLVSQSHTRSAGL